MNDERGPVREIAWRDLCPWLLIFRVYRHAVRLPVLTLATLAVLLTPVGWRIGERIFLREDAAAAEALRRHRDDAGHLHRWPVHGDELLSGDEFRDGGRARLALVRAAGHIASVFHNLIEPFRQALDWRWTLPEFAFFLGGALWTLAVWAFFGGAITRLAVVPLAGERELSLRAAVTHAARRFPTYFFAPLFPFLGVVIGGLALAIFGLLLRLGDVGVLLAGLLWFVAILVGFAMAYLLVGLLFAWPLMWPVASAERDADFFEAVSRAYSYTRQAPLQYLFYALLATLFGGVCWLLVQLFAEAVIALGEWGVAWGAGRERMLELHDAVNAWTGETPVEFPPLARFGLGALVAWTGLVRAVATAFAFSFFWCAYCAIYLLLRHDVDRREMDEVWSDDRRSVSPPSRSAPAPAVASVKAPPP